MNENLEQFTLRMSAFEVGNLCLIATVTNRTINDVAREAVRDYLIRFDPAKNKPQVKA